MYDNSPRTSVGARILFVDDSRLMRFAARRFLRQYFDVVLAEDGQQAWRILQQDDSIQVVITDLMMPEVDGIELIRRIREAELGRIRALPVLVVTSVEEKAGRRRALDVGANDLVPKPFSGTDLVEPVQEYLRRALVSHDDKPQPARLANVTSTRNGLTQRLEQISSFHDRHGLEFSILHAKLDEYDRIASDHGLNWAESMMRHLERVLAREVRVEDTIGRSDDAVFSMILMATPAVGAKQLRARLRGHLERNPARFPGRTMPLKISFSIQCPGTRDGHSAESILRSGLDRLAEPANVTRLADRITA
jgi:diguanylate cyclase (GGDEF)-like protein